MPEPAERASFVLAASLVLVLLFWLWRPIGGTVWDLSGPAAGAIWAVHAAGWVLTVGSTFLISHSDLFGVRQAWRHARGLPYTTPPFTERGLYGRVRHPLMLGFLVVFWSAPTMTAGHLLFAAAATGYVLVGIAFEEHDLARSLGASYTAYRARVPHWCPGSRHAPLRLTRGPGTGETQAGVRRRGLPQSTSAAEPGRAGEERRAVCSTYSLSASLRASACCIGTNCACASRWNAMKNSPASRRPRPSVPSVKL